MDCDMQATKLHGPFRIDKDTNLSKVKNIETATFGKIKVGTFETFRAAAVAKADAAAVATKAGAPAVAGSGNAAVAAASGANNDGSSNLDGRAETEGTPAGSSAATATDGYDAIVGMPFCKSFVIRKEVSAIRVDSTKMANHKDELEHAIEELRGVKGFQLTKETWTGFLAEVEGLYDHLRSLIQNDGNRKLVQILGEILFSDEKADPTNKGFPCLQWQTPRQTFLTMQMLKDGFSEAPPSPGILAAMELAIKAPFRRPEFLEQLNELKKELGYIAAITVSKERVGLLLQQISLSLLFGVSSFMATYIYDLPAFENITGVDDDDIYGPIVDALQSESGDSLALQTIADSQQQQLVNQQQLIQLVGALLNATAGGNEGL